MPLRPIQPVTDRSLMSHRRHVRQPNLTLLSAAMLFLTAIFVFGQLPASAPLSQTKSTELALARQTNHIAVSTAKANRPLSLREGGRDGVGILPVIPALAPPTAIVLVATVAGHNKPTDSVRVYDACAPPTA